ncbi:MAG: glycosyltransferase, partial [Pseudomonadota bacterium]
MHAPRSTRIVLLANAAWNLAHFRRGLIRALVADGHDVVAAAPPGDTMAQLAALGARTVPLPMDPTNASPLHDVALTTRIARMLRTERPDVMLTYTIKPNIFGSAAARLCGVPSIATV